MRVTATIAAIAGGVVLGITVGLSAQQPDPSSARGLYGLLTGVQTPTTAEQTGPAGLAAVLGAGPRPEKGVPAQNLQIFPKDMTRQQLQPIMQGFTKALGVQCSHCHVGTPQDRARDDKPQKLAARRMLQMVMEINDKHVAGLETVGLPAGSEPRMKVTCMQCHRGSLKPQ
jgi:hypothetical protein